jgi:hypothetical protein
VTHCSCYAPRSTWPPYVSHPPREMDETWRPERPRFRYVISGSPSGLVIVSAWGGYLAMLCCFAEFQDRKRTAQSLRAIGAV